jgi:hypothetical protein
LGKPIMAFLPFGFMPPGVVPAGNVRDPSTSEAAGVGQRARSDSMTTLVMRTPAANWTPKPFPF